MKIYKFLSLIFHSITNFGNGQNYKSPFPYPIVEIGYCPKCNVPVLGKKCEICGREPLPLRFHELGDIRPISKREKNILISLIPFKEIRSYLKNRLILLSKQPGLDYRRDVFVDGYRIGRMEYVKEEQWRYKFIPTGKGASLFFSLSSHIDFEIHEKGHLKGKKIKREIEKDWAIAKVGSCVAVVVPEESGAKIKDIFCKKVSQKRKAGMNEAIKANLGHLAYMEKRAIENIRKEKANYVAFSGGKDSEVTMYLAHKAGVNKVIFANTGLEFPETERFVYNFADYLNVELIEVEPKEDFWTLVEEKGIPTKDYRWCTKHLKIDSLKRFKGTIVDGTRKYESMARMRRGKESNIGSLRTIYPIYNWLALDVWLYIHMKGLPYNPLYDMGYERIGCFMCPSMLNSEFHNLRRTHPKLYKRWKNYLLQRGFTGEEIEDGLWRWKELPAKMKELGKP